MTDPPAVVGRGRTAEVIALSDEEVLKLFTPGRPAAAVTGEFERSAMAWQRGLPCARAIRLETRDGRDGIVFERVKGPSMLQKLSAKPWLLHRYAVTLADLARRIHAIEVPDLRSLDDYVKARVRGADLDDRVCEWLLDRAASMPSYNRFCHLDLHPDNVIMSVDGPVVIDWASAVRGDPAADVAQSLIVLTCAAVPPGQRMATVVQAGRRAYAWSFRRSALSGHRQLAERVGQWLPIMAGARLAEGFPDERPKLLELIDRQRRETSATTDSIA